MICQHLCINKVPLFNHLDVNEQIEINALVQQKTVKKGEQVFSPLDQARLIVISNGRVKVSYISSQGKEQILRIISEGDYEGENQLLGSKNEATFGEALEDTTICFLNQKDFHNLLLTYPEIALKLLQLNAEKTEELQRQTHFLTMDKIEIRLSSYLSELSRVYKTNHFVIPMQLKELAAYLGTSPETLSRKLKLLEDEKIINRKQRNIEIIDYQRLLK